MSRTFVSKNHMIITRVVTTRRKNETSNILLHVLSCSLCMPCRLHLLFLLLIIPPLLVLVLFLLRRQLLSISCILSDVLLFSNGLLGTHGRNIAPCGIICRGAMGATVFWVCRKWSNKEWWGWFVLRVYLSLEDFEEPSLHLELLL